MKRTLASLMAAVVSAALAGNGVNPDTVDLSPIPAPAEFKADMDRPVGFGPAVKVTVDCPDAASVGWLNRRFGEWYGEFAPKAVAGTAALTLKAGDEAYAVKADDAGVRIAARTLAGVRWAAYTLRQLAIAKRGTFKVAGYLLPALDVSDAPHLAFRCIHLCWIPEFRPEQIERAIRLAALAKFNYAIVEPWGMYRSERHPWWGWPEGTMTKERVRHLVETGRELGITLIPQLNALGHASLSRSCSIKHAVLDFHPEFEPLFEPGGWNWCLTNPETQRIMRELIDELHENFGRPPFFHLGCDEAQSPSCPECRKVAYGDLVCTHIAGLAKYVEGLGARPMMWHDMLLKRGDPRWKGFVSCGTDETAKLVDMLPKDTVICDWEYLYGRMDKVNDDWPTMKYFKEKGFPVAACPWMNYKSMPAQAGFVAENDGFGFVETTWHRMRGADWSRMYRNGSAAAWGTAPVPTAPHFDTHFANMLRAVGHDMKIRDYMDTGSINYQVPRHWCGD